MQVCDIKELKNKISEEDFEEIYKNIKDKLEATIELTEEDYSKDLDEIAKEREEKLQNLIKNLKISIDTNYFKNKIEIKIEELGYSTCADYKLKAPEISSNSDREEKDDEEKAHE